MEMNEHIYEKSKETLCLNDQQGEFLKNKAACFLCVIYLLTWLVVARNTLPHSCALFLVSALQ